MKFPRYLSLVLLFIAFLFVSLAYGQYNNTNNTDSNRKRNRNNQNDQVNQDQRRRNTPQDNQENEDNKDYTREHRYSYRGQYRNFDNNNHRNRYYYGGRYYGFADYYRYYRTEGNYYTYEGTYGRHDNIFIFTDKYGNEFDLYLAPVERTSRRFRGRPLQVGDSYVINLKTTKVYPRRSNLQVGVNFSFGWGNLSLTNGRYYEMFTSPRLINVRGRLYLR